jgi:hypothetical protein
VSDDPMRALGLALALALFCSAPIFANTILSDSTYTNLSIAQNTYPSGAAGVTITSAGKCASCGQSSAPAIQIITSYTGLGIAGAAVLVVDNNLTYNPLTQGAISSLSASVFHNFTVSGAFSPLGSGSVTLQTAFVPLIFQNGTYYVYEQIAGPNGETTWPKAAPGIRTAVLKVTARM